MEVLKDSFEVLTPSSIQSQGSLMTLKFSRRSRALADQADDRDSTSERILY